MSRDDRKSSKTPVFPSPVCIRCDRTVSTTFSGLCNACRGAATYYDQPRTLSFDEVSGRRRKPSS